MLKLIVISVYDEDMPLVFCTKSETTDERILELVCKEIADNFSDIDTSEWLEGDMFNYTVTERPLLE